MKNEYLKAFDQFAAVYSKMHASLTEFIETKGGKIDEITGNITGLNDATLYHVQQRIDQLNILLEYHTTAKLYIDTLENTIKRLDIENTLLQKGRELTEVYSNDKVLKEIEFYMSFEIVEDTTQDDFLDALRQTKFFIELAQKRKILTLTPEIENKIYWANYFINNPSDLKRFFNNKKTKLGNTLAPSVQKAFSDEKEQL